MGYGNKCLYIITKKQKAPYRFTVEDEQGKKVNVYWLDIWATAKKYDVIYKDKHIFIIKYWDFPSDFNELENG